MKLSETWFSIQGCKADGALRDRLTLLSIMLEWIALGHLINKREPWKTPFAKALDSLTVKDWMEQSEARPKHTDLNRLAVSCIWSTEPENMSLLYMMWYTATNGGLLDIANDQVGGPQQYGIETGLGNLAKRFSEQFKGELYVGTPVHKIVKTGEGFAVHYASATSSGQNVQLPSDEPTLTPRRSVPTEKPSETPNNIATLNNIVYCSDVVVAMSPTAAHKHLTFSPSLPIDHARFLNQKMGHAVKAMVTYKRLVSPYRFDFEYKYPWLYSHSLHCLHPLFTAAGGRILVTVKNTSSWLGQQIH